MNVLDASHIQTDVIVAFNFSYFIFKQHQELLAYFTRVKESLGPDGIFFLDCFGGSECYAPLEEKTAHNGFKYYWDLESYNPINNYVTYHIHFKEKGKSKQKNIFSYHWRMWSLSEIRDILHQAGFKKGLSSIGKVTVRTVREETVNLNPVKKSSNAILGWSILPPTEPTYSTALYGSQQRCDPLLTAADQL